MPYALFVSLVIRAILSHWLANFNPIHHSLGDALS